MTSKINDSNQPLVGSPVKVAKNRKKCISVVCKIQDNLIMCPVCFCRYEAEENSLLSSVFLNCHHSVCRGCLTSLMKTGKGGDPKWIVSCPVCRMDTTVPTNGLEVNFIIVAILENAHSSVNNTLKKRILLVWCEKCEDVANESCQMHKVLKFTEAYDSYYAKLRKEFDHTLKFLKHKEVNLNNVKDCAITNGISALREASGKLQTLVNARISFLESVLEVKNETFDVIKKLRKSLSKFEIEKFNCKLVSRRNPCAFCICGISSSLDKQLRLKELEEESRLVREEFPTSIDCRNFPFEDEVADPDYFKNVTEELTRCFYSFNLSCQNLHLNKCTLKSEDFLQMAAPKKYSFGSLKRTKSF